MTDNQFYILITVVGGGLAAIGAAIRFSVGRIVKALDRNSDSMSENTRSNAVLSTKIDAIASFIQRRDRDRDDRDHSTPREIPRERSRPVRAKSPVPGDRDE